jgi:hypothetical protein
MVFVRPAINTLHEMDVEDGHDAEVCSKGVTLFFAQLGKRLPQHPQHLRALRLLSHSFFPSALR